MLALLPGASLAQPSVQGEWGPLLTAEAGTWQPNLFAIHAIHLPNGKIMMFGYKNQAPQAQLYDPSTGTFAQTNPLTANPSHDIFCSGHTLLEDGRVFFAGGHVVDYWGQKYTMVYNPFSGTTGAWTQTALMGERRWYPSATTLGDGRVLILSGTQKFDATDNDLFYKFQWADTVEVYDPRFDSIEKFPGYFKPHWYPFIFQLPNGNVMFAGRYLRGTWPTNSYSYSLNLTNRQWTPLTGVQPFQGSSAVMYEPGKIMKAGGEDPARTDGHAGTNTGVINTAGSSVVWRSTAPMQQRRKDMNLVLLPDGKVLALGGSFIFDDPSTGQTQRLAEMWNPATETWSPKASMAQARLYHSTAVLLADGRVLSAGGNVSPSGQIYSPPYLFNGPRPVIDAVPDYIMPGTVFSLFSADASPNVKVVLMGLNSVTHAVDFNQKRIPLNFTHDGGNLLTVNAPANNNVAPPGYYMLFLLNEAGVPSVAKYVRIANTTRPIGKKRP